MTACDDVEAYVQMFELTAATEDWEKESWAKNEELVDAI